MNEPTPDAVTTVIAHLRADPAGFPDVQALAAAADRTVEELARAILHRHHLTPEALMLRARLAKVEHLLREDGATLSAAASAAGFSDRSSTERCFRDAYRISPQTFRALDSATEFEIELPSWLRLEDLRAYWGRDPQSVCERVEGPASSWAVRSPGGPLWMSAHLARGRAQCVLQGPAASQPGTAFWAHGTLLRLLGLHLDPRPFENEIAAGPWRKLIAGRLGWTPPQTATFFDGLVWVIAGQQVSLAAAFSIRRRLHTALGEPLGQGLYVPPSAARVAEAGADVLSRHGLTRRKAEYVHALAEHLISGDPAWNVESWRWRSAPDIEQQLLACRGLGPWSVGYLMMRALGFADCVPLGDVALQRKMKQFFALDERPDNAHTLDYMRPFRPYRSLATFHFWALPDSPSG